MSEQPKKAIPYVDLKSLSEDERIQVIGQTAQKTGGKVAFFVDDNPRKIARYMTKLQREFPGIIVTKIGWLAKGSFGLRAEFNTQSTS